MNTKKIIWLFMFIGGAVGGYIPTLWGANSFSMTAILFNALGAMFGVWFGFKISRY